MSSDPPVDDHLIPPYRVLDLTDESGVFCTKLLADYGADVVRIEAPSGDPLRAKGPFPNDEPHPEKSLSFLFYNTNKRSITLNLQTEDGQSLFRRLAEKADSVVESLPVGYLEGLGLDYDSLHEINPQLVMASITPFGQTGPWSKYKSSDLIAMAASGYMQITGEPDEPPLRQGNFQSAYPGAQYASVAILAALYYRDLKGGEGQYIDVSLHEALITYYTDAHPALAWQQMGQNVTRVGTTSTLVIPLGAYPCQGGWISAGIITALFMDFASRFTSEELFHQGQERNLVFLPVNDVADLLLSPCYKRVSLERAGSWEVETIEARWSSPNLGGAAGNAPAPRLGQANQDMLSRCR